MLSVALGTQALPFHSGINQSGGLYITLTSDGMSFPGDASEHSLLRDLKKVVKPVRNVT